MKIARWALGMGLVMESDVHELLLALAYKPRMAWRIATRMGKIDVLKVIVKNLFPRLQKVADGKAHQVGVAVWGKGQSGPANSAAEINNESVFEDAKKNGFLVLNFSEVRAEIYAV